jgi:hypothetical protein
LSHEDKLTLIVAALLYGTNYSTVNTTVITNTVNAAEDIVKEIDSRKENNATG